MAVQCSLLEYTVYLKTFATKNLRETLSGSLKFRIERSKAWLDYAQVLFEELMRCATD